MTLRGDIDLAVPAACAARRASVRPESDELAVPVRVERASVRGSILRSCYKASCLDIAAANCAQTANVRAIALRIGDARDGQRTQRFTDDRQQAPASAQRAITGYSDGRSRTR